MSECAAIKKVLRVHSGEEFEADDFPTAEDGKRAVKELGALLAIAEAALIVVNDWNSMHGQSFYNSLGKLESVIREAADGHPNTGENA